MACKQSPSSVWNQTIPLTCFFIMVSNDEKKPYNDQFMHVHITVLNTLNVYEL